MKRFGFLLTVLLIFIEIKGGYSVPQAEAQVVGTPPFAFLRKRGPTCATTRASCSAHLSAGCATSGTYSIVQSGNTYNVYCDMTTSGGGWFDVLKSYQMGLISASNGGVAESWNGAELSIQSTIGNSSVCQAGTLSINIPHFEVSELYYSNSGASHAYTVTSWSGFGYTWPVSGSGCEGSCYSWWPQTQSTISSPSTISGGASLVSNRCCGSGQCEGPVTYHKMMVR